MLPAFVIALREGLETAVVLGAIALFLSHQGKHDQLRRMWIAAAAAAVSCVGLTVGLRVVEVSLSSIAEDRFEAIVSVAAVLTVAYMVVWMRRFPKDLVLDAGVGGRSQIPGPASGALVTMAFFAVLREGLEIAVFLLALSGARTSSPGGAISGAVAGLLVAAAAGVFVVRHGRRLDIARFFRLTAVVLVVAAAGLTMNAVASANAGGWLVFGQTPQFDWSGFAPPGTVVGSIVTGTLGIQPYPDPLQVSVWLSCLVVLLGVVLLPRRGHTVRNRHPGSAGRRVVLIVNAGCLFAVGVVIVGVRATLSDAAVVNPSQLPEMQVPAGGLTSGSYLLFQDTTPGTDFGKLGLVSASNPSGPRAITGLSCDRVDFEGGLGLCLERPMSGFLVSTVATIFDSHFQPLRQVDLTGQPSRARVSPDGRYGAVTTFVTGDSYAAAGTYSTRTDIIDMQTGKILFDLADLNVTRDGLRFEAADFNFWGVTFSTDGRHFYATLGTGGETYLIEADLLTRQAKTITTNVECPSLSPDGREIAFKRRLPGLPVRWRLSVLDLATMKVHAVAETRSIDDQVEWLDNDTILYGVPEAFSGIGSQTSSTLSIPSAAELASDTWEVPADGGGSPKLFSKDTWSEIVPKP